MTHPLLPQTSAALKQRLLTGASAAVIVLALGVAMPSGAMAQTSVTADITADAAVNDAANLQAINAGFEHDGTANGRTVTINLNNVDADSAEFTNETDGQWLTIDIIDGSGDNVANTLTLTGDATASNGGRLAINVGNGTTQPVSLEINGNVTEETGSIVTIDLGDAAGGDQAASLVFDASGATQTIDSAITVADDADTVTVTVTNTGVAGGTTTTFTDTIALGENDTIDIVGNAAGSVTAVFEDNVTLSTTGGVIDVDSAAGTATLVLGADGAETTVTAAIDNAAGASSTLTIADGADVTVVGNINATTGWSEITVGDGAETTLTLQGNSAAGAALELSDNATLVVDATGFARTIGDTVDAAAPGTTTTLQTTGDSLVTFEAAVGGTEPISLIDLDTATTFDLAVSGGDFDIDGNTTATGSLTATGDVDVGAGFTALLDNSSNTIEGDITGDGTLIIGNSAGGVLNIGVDGEMSTVSIAALNGGTNPGGITIVDGAMVTITSTIGAGGNDIHDFTSDGAGTTLTINSGTDAGGETSVTGNGALVLGEGTVILGSNIGNGDTVFSFASDATLVTEANDTTTIQVSANVLETGDVITFAATGADQSAAFDDVLGDGELEVTQTALTTFVLAAAGNDITITATARSASDTADELGISEEDAVALRQAVVSTGATGDDEGLDALTAALNAGNPTAAQAAESVGTQEDTLGGASEASFALFGEQAGAITNRLQNARSQSGFSGGDLDGPYSPQAPSSMGGVWGQAFGGVANADGDTNFAGWDAAYGGMMIGIDGMVSDDITIGAFGSYSYSNVDGDGAGNSEIEANTFGFGVYAGYAGEGFYLDGFAAYAASQNDLTRQDALNRTITADYDASQFSIGAAGGVPIEVSSNVFITPNASLTWNHYDADTYTETGSPLAQTVNPDAVSNLTGTIGARIHAVYENFDNDGTVFIPELRVALIGDLIDDDATATATFAGAGVASYQVTGADTDDIGALIGIGFGLDNPDWSAGISYDADLRGDYMSHTGRAEFRWKF